MESLKFRPIFTAIFIGFCKIFTMVEIPVKIPVKILEVLIEILAFLGECCSQSRNFCLFSDRFSVVLYAFQTQYYEPLASTRFLKKIEKSN